MEIAELFGRNVRQKRIALNVSQEELGHRAGLHRTYISDIERGARNPTLKVMNKIAQVLGVDLSSLLG